MPLTTPNLCGTITQMIEKLLQIILTLLVIITTFVTIFLFENGNILESVIIGISGWVGWFLWFDYFVDYWSERRESKSKTR